MKLPLHSSAGGIKNEINQAANRKSNLGICFLILILFLLSGRAVLAQQHPDLPNPAPNIQTATIGSLVIPMDNNKQNVGTAFNLKAYGLIHKLLLNDIPVKWIIRSGKEKDSVDFSATAERLYPSYQSSSMINFVASEFIIDSVWANNPSPTSGKTANQIITSFGNNVAVFRLTQDAMVDVRYTLNFRPKLAVFNNGGNQNIHVAILNAAGVTNYITTGAGVFPGIFQCFTFASEPHWSGSYPSDTPITNNIKNFVLQGGNFLAECRGVLTYENLSKFHTDNGIDILNRNVINTYHNNDLAYMQFHGAMKANEGGSERNWVRSDSSSWVPGFYYGVSDIYTDTIIASGAHIIDPDSAGGNVYYLGGHDYSPFTALLQINAARLYLNATLVPSGRPSPFSVSLGSGTTICAGSNVTLGGSPTGPAGAVYTWTPSSSLNDTTLSNPIATPVSSTTYYVTVYKSGCYSQGSVPINVASPMASIITPTNVSCHGGSDGSLSAAVIGGNAPYTYLWSNGQTGSVATGLSAGIYSVGVTSAVGCTRTFTDTVTEPIAPLSSSITPTHVSCFGGSNGTATVTASGGTTGYTYLWNSGQTTASASGLPAGNYSVTVTDSNGCSSVSAVAVTQPTVLSSSVTSTNVSCVGGSNGTATVAATGGITGYSYLWNNGQTTALSTGLSAGSYSVTVTDTNGCTTTSPVTITQPSTAISSSITQTNQVCNGGNIGSASVSVTGGVPSYSYLWSNGQTSSSLSGLTAGNYSVTITDSVGCTHINACTITEPTAVTASMSMTPATVCNNNGTASVVASGGKPPYLYAWNTGATTTTITGLYPGPYSVTITDSSNCTHTDVIAVLSNPSAVAANAGPDQHYCIGDSIQLNASGGVIYSWFPAVALNNPGIPNPVASPTTTTTYMVYVTDTGGCIGSDSMTIVVHPLPVADAGASLSICQNSSDTLHASGGITYSWSPAAGLTNPNISNPVVMTSATKTYTVTVTDVNGCVASDSTTVTVNSLPVVNAGSDVSICLNDTSMLNASGGITYSWSPFTGLNNPAISNPRATPVSSTMYTVTAMDGNGCSAKDSVTVAVNPLPIANAGTDQSICLNNSCTLNASGGINYSWSPTTGLSNPNIYNPVASPLVTTTYVMRVTDVNGCGRADTMRVAVNPLPVANAGTNLTICLNAADTLRASGGINYSWSPAGGLTNPGISNPVASPSGTITYTVTITDINGCVNSDSAIVMVNPLPVVNAGSDVSICMNDTFMLNASGGISYSWSPVTGLNNSAISNPLASPVASTIYVVTAVDGNGCSATDDVDVILNPLPIVSAGTNQSICLNNSCTLNASGGINYTWSPATGLSDPDISNPVASPLVTTTYVTHVSDANGCGRIDSMRVTVNPLPVANAGTNLTICLNAADTLHASGGINYLWSPAAGLNDSVNANPVASPSGTTTYTVTITDINGCVDSDSATVMVNALPVVNAGTDASICLNDTFMLNASGGINYSWSPVTGLNNSNISDPLASPVASTIYTVIAVDGNGCSATDDVIITINPLPLVSAGANQNICLNNSCTLNASGGINYSWSPATGLSDQYISNPVASPLVTTTYIIYVTDTNGCGRSDSMRVIVNPLPVANAGTDLTICRNSSSTLHASGGISYSWMPQTGLNNPLLADPVVSAASTTVYTVTVTDANGCIASDNARVVVNPIPIADAGNNAIICMNDTVMLNASGGINYSWSPSTGLSNAGISNPVASPATTIIYTVLATDSNGCSATDDVLVIVNPLPTASAGGNQNICVNTSCTLNASGGISYGWSPETGLSDTTSRNPIASPANTIIYTVRVSDANGCINTASAAVLVNALPVITVDSQTICEGLTTTLTAAGGTQYTWSSGQSTPVITVSPSVTTDYQVIVANATGCADTAMTRVTVKPAPYVYAGEDTTILVGATIQLHAAGNGLSYQWVSENNMTCSSCLNPFIKPFYTENYIINTTAANGCRSSDTVTVYVDDCLSLYIPNAFTPVNTDHVNDVFIAQGNCIDQFEFYIFDRWGMQIFESHDLAKGWDGTFMGHIVQEDVYVWLAKARSVRGVEIYKTGKVTVMK